MSTPERALTLVAVEAAPAEAATGAVAFKDALLVAIAAGLGYGFDSYAVNIYSLVLPLIAITLHASLGLLGVVGSIFQVGYTIGFAGLGPTIPFLATAGLWLLTIAGYLLGPETRGRELEEVQI